MTEGKVPLGDDPSKVEPWECVACFVSRDMCKHHTLHGWTPRNREERRRAARQAKRRARTVPRG